MQLHMLELMAICEKNSNIGQQGSDVDSEDIAGTLVKLVEEPSAYDSLL